MTKKVKDIVSKNENDDIKVIEEEKKKRFIDEFRSFFILALIIGGVVLAGWLFYKYAKPIVSDDKQENKEVIESENYKIVVYKSELDNKYLNVLHVLNDKYLLEFDDTYIRKIMDLEGNVLYESSEDEEYQFFVGTDGNLYAIGYYNSVFALYVLENEKIVEVKEFSEENYYYVPLMYVNGDTMELMGISGERYYNDEYLNERYDSYIYSLNGTENLFKDIEIYGDTRNSEAVDSYNSKYVVVKSGDDFGLLDIETGKLTIEPKYEELFTANDNNYIAFKDNKAGIINTKLKKIVDFEYDFIAVYDEFYVVSKNSKLAIMDLNHKFVTGFEFDYQKLYEEKDGTGYNYRLCCSGFNSFNAYKYNNKYVLIINYHALIHDYKKNEAYIIDENGEYRTIKEDFFEIDKKHGFIYSYLDKERVFTFYDALFKEKFIVDVSRYDYEKFNFISFDNNIIKIKLDNDLYFDGKTGKELENNSVKSFKIGNYYLESNSDNKTIVKVNDDVVTTLEDISLEEVYYKMVDDDNFYYVNDDIYVMIKKR